MDTKERISFLRRKNIKPGYIVKIKGSSYTVVCAVTKNMELETLYEYSEADGYSVNGYYSYQKTDVSNLEKFPYEIIKDKEKICGEWRLMSQLHIEHKIDSKHKNKPQGAL